MERSIATQTIENRIREAVSRLMATAHGPETFRVGVPVLYPSGTIAAVEISGGAGECFVSDFGVGHSEAFLANAGEFYDHQARQAASRFGIGYDGQSIFLMHAPMDRIEGAILAVSNASVQAASLAILRSEEDREKRRNDEVYDRIRSVFGKDTVTKLMQIEGQRAVWPAHNVVALPHGQRAVFEFVTSHPNSVSNKFMMFSDLSAASEALSLNAVVKSIDTLGQKGSMLQDICNIVPLNASREDFERYARAA